MYSTIKERNLKEHFIMMGLGLFYMFVAYFLKVLASLDRAEIYTA